MQIIIVIIIIIIIIIITLHREQKQSDSSVTQDGSMFFSMCVNEQSSAQFWQEHLHSDTTGYRTGIQAHFRPPFFCRQRHRRMVK